MFRRRNLSCGGSLNSLSIATINKKDDPATLVLLQVSSQVAPPPSRIPLSEPASRSFTGPPDFVGEERDFPGVQAVE